MLKAFLAGGLFLTIASGAARADDTSGEIEVVPARVPGVRALAAALDDAQGQAGEVRVAQFLAVLPLADADSTRLDAAYPDGLHAECADGACTMDGQGTAARAHIDDTSDEFKGVDVGLKEEIKGAFKVVETAGVQTVSVCNVTGVYFAKLIFRKNLINFQFVDKGGSAITARYELAGATAQIHCD